MGAEAYAKIGTPNNTGTRIIGVSGHVQRPGYYELEAGKGKSFATVGALMADLHADDCTFNGVQA